MSVLRNGERHEHVTVDRLTLISEVEWFYLQEPTFVRAGQTFWVGLDREALCVDRGNDRVTRHSFVTERTGDMRR